MNRKAFFATLKITTKQQFDGGIFHIIKKFFLRFLFFVFMTAVWKGVAPQGSEGMTLEQILTYSLISTIFWQQMNIITPATSALWEGSIIGRYTRPMPVFSSFIAETVGNWWIPAFVCFGLPLWLAAPLFGINPFPASLGRGIYFVISMILSASLGFAMDFIFSAVVIRLKNGCWAVLQIRESIIGLLSGGAIPFALLPTGLARALEILPFASLSSAPLGIYVGVVEPLPVIALQIFWNLVGWIVAIKVYKKSEERMISYGG